LAHHSEKEEGSILTCRVPPLWPICVGERRTTFAKAYGINVRCYWELFEEHVRNLGTFSFDPCLTPKKSFMESQLSTLHTKTQLEKSSPSAPPSPTRQKGRTLHFMTRLPSHWLHENSISKIGCHSFWPVLIALPKSTLSIHLSSPIHQMG
jgi:hypothetical protein